MATKRRKADYHFWDTETINGFEGEAVVCQFLTIDENGKIIIPANVDCVGTRCTIEWLDRVVESAKKRNSQVVVAFAHNAFFDLMRVISQLAWIEKKQGFTDYAIRINSVAGQMVFGEIVYKGVRIQLRDTFRILMGSLKKLSKSFLPPELRKKDFDWTPESYSDPYNMTEEEKEYALYDVISLKEIIIRYAKSLGKDFTQLKMTLASEAFSACIKEYENVYLESDLNARSNGRKGKYVAAKEELNKLVMDKYYHGGRIYIPNNHNPHKKLDGMYYSFDITSSYPYQMYAYHYPLPGQVPTFYKHLPSGCKCKDYEGRYLVTIKVHNYKSDLPILPYKPTGKTYKVYPHGTFETSITDFEYRMFLEHSGETQHEILEVIHWNKKQCGKWLKPFVDRYYKMKQAGDELNEKEKGSGDAMRTTAKGIVNTPYGKFAQQYESGESAEWGRSELLKEVSKTSKDHRISYISAFITGAARCHLYGIIDYYGADNVAYSDTDSAKISMSAYIEMGKYPLESDTALGGWKNEGLYRNLYVVAPKVYMGEHKEPKSDKWKLEVKAKGISTTQLQYINNIDVFGKNEDEVAKTVYTQFEKHHKVIASYKPKPVKVKTYKKEGEFAKESTRTLTTPDKVTGYHYNGETYQIHIVGKTI